MGKTSARGREYGGRLRPGASGRAAAFSDHPGACASGADRVRPDAGLRRHAGRRDAPRFPRGKTRGVSAPRTELPPGRRRLPAPAGRKLRRAPRGSGARGQRGAAGRPRLHQRPDRARQLQLHPHRPPPGRAGLPPDPSPGRVLCPRRRPRDGGGFPRLRRGDKEAQEYFVYFKFFRQSQAEKMPSRRARRFIQRFLRLPFCGMQTKTGRTGPFRGTRSSGLFSRSAGLTPPCRRPGSPRRPRP